MKVTMSADSKRIITLEEAPIARAIIANLKEDESTAAEYIRYAINAACGHCEEVYKATATIAKNCRAWNSIIENSADIDVWIDATARTSDGFCIIGAYLTDIWSLSGDNAKEMANHMYTRIFTEKR